jgi:L-threonylcarbamoyladenylate synthase
MTATIRLASDAAALQEAARRIRAGELVAFPTETVYGLGANALDARAVARVFAVKRRPAFDPLIVHVEDLAGLGRVAIDVPAEARALAERFWPGPLTLVLCKRPELPDLVTSGLATVGVRVPDHAAARALIAAAGVPLAAPSANPFGYVSPTTAAHVADQLGDDVALILDGGPCRVGLESTVLTLLDGDARILRPGGVTREELEQALGRPVALAPSTDRPQAPGQLTRHYATRTPLVIQSAAALLPPGARAGLLARTAAPQGRFAAIETLAPDGDVRTAAAHLFAALRRLDSAGLDLLVAEPWDEEGLGGAIMDRLRRCAAR